MNTPAYDSSEMMAVAASRRLADGAVDPRDSILRQMESPLLLKIERGSDNRRHGEDHQKRADELCLQFFHCIRPSNG